MSDMFADNLVKSCIGEIIEKKDTIKDNVAIWKSMTRLMFKRYSAHEVYSWIEEALAEASDEQWFEKKYPKGFFDEEWVYPKKKSVIKINLKKAKRKKQINEHLKIKEVARDYGIKVRGNSAICPFHNDKKASLRFYPITNSFNCFGCKAGGDVVEFIRRCEKNDNPHSSRRESS